MFFSVPDEQSAIQLANNSDFGFGGCIFTKDIPRGRRLASFIETGMVFINNIDWADAELPMGGIKNSGTGQDMGLSALHEFVSNKLIRTHNMKAPFFLTAE